MKRIEECRDELVVRPYTEEGRMQVSPQTLDNRFFFRIVKMRLSISPRRCMSDKKFGWMFLTFGSIVVVLTALLLVFAPIAPKEGWVYIILAVFAIIGVFFLAIGALELGWFDKKEKEEKSVWPPLSSQKNGLPLLIGGGDFSFIVKVMRSFNSATLRSGWRMLHR